MYLFKTGVIILFLMLPVIAMGAGYQKIETDHFIIQFSPGDAGIAEDLEAESEGIRRKIIDDMGSDFPDRTVVIISPTIEAFQNDQPAGTWVPLWAAGIAYPERNLIIIRSPKAVKKGHIDYLEVFIHELTHIALGRVLKGKEVPIWLSEGLAMYESREWKLYRHAVLTEAVLTGKLIPLSVLTRSFPSDERVVELAYAESFIFISFIINKIGIEAFHQFIRNYGRSGDLQSSLRRATGMHLDELEEKWLSYLKMRSSWLPIILSASTLWFLASLIFVYGYFRKRRASRLKIRQWEEEEKIQAVQDDETRYLH